MQRRHFLTATAGALLALRATQAADGAVTVLLNETVGPISPLIHGHFVEHLGGVVYDGIWVGEGSKVPNVAGLRKALIDALKRIQAPLSPVGSTTLAAERGTAPFNVQYWGIGNESWCCGGDLNWTRGFFQALTRKSPNLVNRVWGWALHYYCATAGGPVEFNEAEYYELLTKAVRMEDLIREHWTVVGESDRNHRVKFAVDEWGAWHKAGSEVAPITSLARSEPCVTPWPPRSRSTSSTATPNYHVFDLYKEHKGGQAVRAVFAAPSRGKLPGLDGSASITGKKLVLTCTNSSLTAAMPVEVKLAGGTAKTAVGTVLSAAKPQAHNSFAQPDLITPQPLQAQASGAAIRFEMPAASVARIVCERV